MNYYKLPLDKKIGMAELAIENSRRSSYIMERIEPYQYDENKPNQGTGAVSADI